MIIFAVNAFTVPPYTVPKDHLIVKRGWTDITRGDNFSKLLKLKSLATKLGYFLNKKV